MPGDVLGIIEQFLPGEGTYDNEGSIKSSILGNVQINSKMKTISVMPKSGKPALLEVGDTVYGQITDVKAQRVNVNIDRLKNTTRPLALPYIGAIHISQVKEGYLDKLTDAFRIGDIIEATVVKITGDNVDLSTKDRKPLSESTGGFSQAVRPSQKHGRTFTKTIKGENSCYIIS